MNKLIKNASHIFLTSVITSFMGFIFLTIATRLFSPEFVGLNQTVLSASLTITAIAIFGFNLSLLVYIPKSKEKENLANTAFTFSIVLAILLSIFYSYFIKYFLPNQDVFTGAVFIVVFVLLTALWTAGIIIDTLFVAFKSTKMVLVRNASIAISRIPLIFLPIGNFVWLLAIIIPLSIASVYSALKLQKISKIKLRPYFSKKIFLSISNLSIANNLSWGFSYVVLLLFSTALMFYSTPKFVAYFSVAWTIATLIYAIPLSISQILISEASASPKNKKKLVRKAILYSILSLTPISLITIMSSKWILSIFGTEYINASGALILLTITSFVISGLSIYSALKNIEEKPKKIIILNVSRIVIILGVMLCLNNFTIESISLAWFIGNLLVLLPTIPTILKQGDLLHV